MDNATEKASEVFCITHNYDIGDQRQYVQRVSGEMDARRAALYCQFRAEEWFDESASLSNECIAAALIAFYGFAQAFPCETATVIDMYYDRESACGDEYQALMADQSLVREGLRSFIEPRAAN